MNTFLNYLPRIMAVAMAVAIATGLGWGALFIEETLADYASRERTPEQSLLAEKMLQENAALADKLRPDQLTAINEARVVENPIPFSSATITVGDLRNRFEYLFAGLLVGIIMLWAFSRPSHRGLRTDFEDWKEVTLLLGIGVFLSLVVIMISLAKELPVQLAFGFGSGWFASLIIACLYSYGKRASEAEACERRYHERKRSETQ